MSESSAHKYAAQEIAKKYGGTYNREQGVDIVTSEIAIEVETADTVTDGIRQLQGHSGPVYIAGTDDAAVQKAIVAVKGTSIGVMDAKGNIVVPSTRK